MAITNLINMIQQLFMHIYFSQNFKPKVKATTSVSENFKAMASPIYIFILFVWFTAFQNLALNNGQA